MQEKWGWSFSVRIIGYRSHADGLVGHWKKKNNTLGSCQLSNVSQATGVRGEMPPSLTAAAENFAWHMQTDVLLSEPVQSPLYCNGVVE